MKKFLVLLFVGTMLWNGYPQRFYDAKGYWSGQVRSLSAQLQSQQSDLDELKAEQEKLASGGFHGGKIGLRYPAAAIEALKEENKQKQEKMTKNIQAKTTALMEAQLQLSWTGGS